MVRGWRIVQARHAATAFSGKGAAKTGGIKNYFVEMNLDLMKASVPYLRNLEV